MRKFLLLVLLLTCLPVAAHASCNGQFPPGTVCGNSSGGNKFPSPVPYLFGSSITTTPTYTPPGVGAQQIPLATRLSRTIYANDFGAACDGTTDDSVAFQNAATTGINRSIPVRFTGGCAINSVGLVFDNTIDFGGNGNGAASFLLCAAGLNCITADTDAPVYIHDFTVAYQSTSGSDTGIVITSTSVGHTFNVSSYIWRMIVEGPFNALNFANANGWTLRDSQLTAAGGDALRIADTFVCDDGANTAYGNQFGETVAGGNGIHWVSSGGTRIINNIAIAPAWQNAVLIDLDPSCPATSDIWVIGNHLEGYGLNVNSACVRLQRNNGTSMLGNVVITNNECANPDIGVYEPLDGTGQWLNTVTIGDNVIGMGNGTTSWAYRLLTPINGLSIHHGALQGNATTNFSVVLGTQTSTNCAVGPIPRTGTFSASTLSSCTSYPPN